MRLSPDRYFRAKKAVAVVAFDVRVLLQLHLNKSG